uniref:hypothetical protein n=1 Tax=Enterobacter sp. RFL1396 TaxID=211595 RepID=UPI00146A5CBF|nr:hypothetical protein [Enterobacter sp. RFL1396]
MSVGISNPKALFKASQVLLGVVWQSHDFQVLHIDVALPYEYLLHWLGLRGSCAISRCAFSAEGNDGSLG